MRMNMVSGTLTVKDVDDQRKNSLNIVSGAKGTAIRKKNAGYREKLELRPQN